MNISLQLRRITKADKRIVAVGATVAATALIGGLAFAASGPDPGGGTGRAATIESSANDAERPGAATSVSAEQAAQRVTPPTSDPATPSRPADEQPAVTSAPGPTARVLASTGNNAAGGTKTSSDGGPAGTGASPDHASSPNTIGQASPSSTSPSIAAASQAPTSTVPTTSAPAPGELEPEPGADAGKVVNFDTTTEQPSHPAPSQAVNLDLVEGAAPPPPPTPSPVAVPTLPTTGGGLVSNAYGCESKCIVHATLQQHPLSPNLEFDLETNVTTGAGIWVSTSQPVVDEGQPVVQGWPQYLGPGWVKEWKTTIELEFDTTYWITLRVEDTQGNLKWAITDHSTGSPPTPDQLVAAGDGCYFQCISFGNVEYTDSYDKVFLVIGTDVPPAEDVVFDIAVSASPPTWSGDTPTLSSQFPFVVDQDGGNDVRGHVSGLSPETTYHVVVRAIDDDGYMAHAVGQFTTDPEPPTEVRVTWERFFVHYDGDAGGWGRGEIAWAWGMNDQPGLSDWGTPYRTYGARNQDKIGDGTSIVLGQNTHHWVTVRAGEALPSVAVNAHENDTHGNIEYDQCIDYRQVTVGWQQYQGDCMTRTNVALVEGLTLADVTALPRCWEFDVPNERGEDRCLVLESLPANDQHARFDVLLSFHVPT